MIDQLREALKNGQVPSDIDLLYMYSPLCGTCHVTSRMLDVVEHLLPELQFERLNVNEVPDLAKAYQVESVPCLIVWRTVAVKHNQQRLISQNTFANPQKIYAFHSIPYLYERLRGGGMDDSSR
ncbi:thioredoxin family protein [Paenibacillus arenosi]|uniref:Thioredoxin family protein n=1 Tax=Paenibacillus arenosi TaxID=2774142 RepID=A0ABR9ATN3_9BACL|nr:thioredoxin family protein [Paenibacillus arenosi]MBD8497470.1 thioredoxin family protein [Paenibacillus arenosi]